jgi:triosephosphate isomerase
MRKPLVAGNWKMNGSLESVQELLSGILAGLGEVKVAEVAVCPPYVYIPAVQSQLRHRHRLGRSGPLHRTGRGIHR